MKTLEYFFECYFNISADYSELDELIKEFINIENESYIKNLRCEIEDIVSSRNWNIIIDIASLKGGRRLDATKSDAFIKHLKSTLDGEIIV